MRTDYIAMVWYGRI